MTDENSENKVRTKFFGFFEKYLRMISYTSIKVAGLSFNLPIDELLNPKTIDQRIQRLSTLKTDLQDSIQAIEELEFEAKEKKTELTILEKRIKQLTEDKTSTETLLQISSESLGRILATAERKSRVNGIIVGIVIGLITGGVSSYIVWLITK